MVPRTMRCERTAKTERSLRITGVSGARGSGESDTDRESDLRESLTESRRAYLHFGDCLPIRQSVIQTARFRSIGPIDVCASSVNVTHGNTETPASLRCYELERDIARGLLVPV
jgi:hypothetical protein